MNTQELSDTVDAYYEKRQARLAAAREVELLDKEEKALKAKVIEALNETKSTSHGGQKAKVTLQKKKKPTCSNWPLLYEHIKKNDAFDLLQKRLTETAVALRWEEGLDIPGVDAFPVDDLSISKV